MSTKLTDIINEFQGKNVVIPQKDKTNINYYYDPNLRVPGVGVMKRSALRIAIRDRMFAIARSLKNVEYDLAQKPVEEGDYDVYNELYNTIYKSGVLKNMIETELQASRELELMRRRGGKRGDDIPDQNIV